MSALLLVVPGIGLMIASPSFVLKMGLQVDVPDQWMLQYRCSAEHPRGSLIRWQLSSGWLTDNPQMISGHDPRTGAAGSSPRANSIVPVSGPPDRRLLGKHA